MWVQYNPNPVGRSVGDCSVRAVAKALDTDWETAYAMIAKNGFLMGDMPSSDSVWGAVLRQNGYIKQVVQDDETADEFCKEHPQGTFVLGFGGHTATVIDGNLYDSWDSSNEVVQYYWEKQ